MKERIKSFAKSLPMKKAFVNPHAIFCGKNFSTEWAVDGLFVRVMSLSVLVNVGIFSVADLAVSCKYPNLTLRKPPRPPLPPHIASLMMVSPLLLTILAAS